MAGGPPHCFAAHVAAGRAQHWWCCCLLLPSTVCVLCEELSQCWRPSLGVMWCQVVAAGRAGQVWGLGGSGGWLSLSSGFSLFYRCVAGTAAGISCTWLPQGLWQEIRVTQGECTGQLGRQGWGLQCPFKGSGKGVRARGAAANLVGIGGQRHFTALIGRCSSRPNQPVGGRECGDRHEGMRRPAWGRAGYGRRGRRRLGCLGCVGWRRAGEGHDWCRSGSGCKKG